MRFELPANERPPVIVGGVLPLNLPAPGLAPFGFGLPPLGGLAGRLRNGFLNNLTARLFAQANAAGAEVVAFARPHELNIVVGGEDASGVPARISRILSFGVTARVELDGLNGSQGQIFEVEMTREEVGRLGLHEGQAVRLVPSRLSIFERGVTGAPAPEAPNWEI